MRLQVSILLRAALAITSWACLYTLYTCWSYALQKTTATALSAYAGYNGSLSDLLLYKKNKTLKELVQKMHSSGEMLRVLQTVRKNVTRLPQSYPNLNFTGYSFTSFDGNLLETKQVISSLLLHLRTPQHPVTNVVHHYAISNVGHRYHLPFKGYVSLLSSLWLSGADLVIVWFNRQPGGRYWRLFLSNVTESGVQERVVFGNRSIPSAVFGNRISRIENKVDVMKLEDQILLGGIFLDNDVVTVRSLQPLRRDSCVIGQDLSNRLCCGTVAIAPANPFPIIMYMMYQAFCHSQYDLFSMHLSNTVWKRRPNLCRVEKEKMCKPTWQDEQMRLLYEDLSTLPIHWNWRRNYMVNMWRKTHVDFAEDKLQLETVGSAKSMFGQVARHVLFGTN